ncbi:helix-turn-helix transcriptional regulator [Kribbella sp. NPDC051137]|uniref:helix-turn-helix domain-containing protein n=1 Tax=Kribbella sp. NPDC051137 TaxID=3155045 RepID=UPI00341C8504
MGSNPLLTAAKAAGLTLTEVAERLGTSVSYVSRLASGERVISARHAETVAEMLGIAPAEVRAMCRQRRPIYAGVLNARQGRSARGLAKEMGVSFGILYDVLSGRRPAHQKLRDELLAFFPGVPAEILFAPVAPDDEAGSDDA